MAPSISLLVAAYNEEASLERTLERALRTLRECAEERELIILDDASRDRTPQIIATFATEHPQEVRALHHERNQGIASTFEDLYRAATKDYVFLISGDGEYPPEALRDCMPLLSSCDIVVCRRRTKHYTFYRRCVSSAYRLSILLLFGIDLFDPGSIKVVHRKIFREIHVRSRSVFVEAERLIRALKRGNRVGYMEIDQERRSGGRGRGARLKTVWAAARDLLSLWIELTFLRRTP